MTLLLHALRAGLILLLVAFAFLTNSCGFKRSGTVKGTITVNGQKLDRGLITFLSEAGNRDSFSASIVDGEYETEAIPVGNAKIVVIGSNESGAPAAPVEKDLGDLAAPAKRGAAKVDTMVVPDKYQSADTSPLTITIKSGKNTFDADLTP
jgi:hypothetical protein